MASSNPRYAEAREESTNTVTRWTLAAVLASMAMVGALSLIVALMLLLSAPPWAEGLIAAGLIGGSLLYAWTLAVAMAQEDRSRRGKIR